MAVVADIIILAVLIAAVCVGARRGLVRSLAGLAVLLVAFFGASWCANHLTEPLAARLETRMTQSIEEKLETGDVSRSDASQMLEAFRFRGSSLQKMLDTVTQRVQETGENLVRAVSASVAHSVASAVIYAVAFLLLSVVGRLVLGLLARIVEDLPLVGALNGIGGAALDLIGAVLALFVVVWLLLRFGWLITPEMVDRSLLLKIFANHTPASLLASL